MANKVCPLRNFEKCREDCAFYLSKELLKENSHNQVTMAGCSYLVLNDQLYAIRNELEWTKHSQLKMFNDIRKFINEQYYSGDGLNNLFKSLKEDEGGFGVVDEKDDDAWDDE